MKKCGEERERNKEINENKILKVKLLEIIFGL